MHDSPIPGAVGRRPRSALARVFLAAAPVVGLVFAKAFCVAAVLTVHALLATLAAGGGTSPSTPTGVIVDPRPCCAAPSTTSGPTPRTGTPVTVSGPSGFRYQIGSGAPVQSLLIYADPPEVTSPTQVPLP